MTDKRVRSSSDSRASGRAKREPRRSGSERCFFKRMERAFIRVGDGVASGPYAGNPAREEGDYPKGQENYRSVGRSKSRERPKNLLKKQAFSLPVPPASQAGACRVSRAVMQESGASSRERNCGPVAVEKRKSCD